MGYLKSARDTFKTFEDCSIDKISIVNVYFNFQSQTYDRDRIESCFYKAFRKCLLYFFASRISDVCIIEIETEQNRISINP